jgi:phosphatidylinositol glycan class W
VSIFLLGYQEHVSEYGVHWNFFATLAVVTVLAAAAGVPARRGVAVGCALIVLHQALLNHAGLAAYVRSHPRSNFVHANKEGVVSTLGYYGLFLVGTGVGDSLARRRGRRAWVRALGLVTGGSLLAYAIVAAAWDYEAPSRRITNAPYLIFTIAYNLQQLAAFLAADLVVRPGPQPIAAAVNRNQLLVFIAANLATGAVNLSIDTLAVPAAAAVAVLLVYLAAVTAAAYALEVKGITAKFW